MKKLLLSTAMAIGIGFSMSAPAQAQMPVIDKAQIAQNVQQLLYWVQQLAEMKAQYEQLVLTYNALAHVTDLGGLAGTLGGITRTHLPEYSAMADLLSGADRLWGRGGHFNLNDAYYITKRMDTWAQEMERRQHVTSNAKALADAANRDSQLRLRRLASLQARLSVAKDVTEVNAVTGLIAVEQQNIDLHKGQIENLKMMLDAEDRVTEQRVEQRQRESAERLLRVSAPIGGGFR